MFKHILLPIDGSELSLSAAKMGIELAQTCGARVYALHVVPVFQAISYMYKSEALAAYEPTYAKEATRIAVEYLAQVQRLAEDAGVKYSGSYDVAEYPYEIILQTARDKGCDLVVMGSHGRRGLSRLLLGSVTQKVLLQGDVAVLVCRRAIPASHALPSSGNLVTTPSGGGDAVRDSEPVKLPPP